MTPHIKDLIFGDNYEGKAAFDPNDTYYLDIKDLSKDDLPEIVLDIASILKSNNYLHPGFVFRFLSDELLEQILESFHTSAIPECELVKYNVSHEEQMFAKKSLNAIATLLLTGEGLGMYSNNQKAIAVQMLHLLANVEKSFRGGLCKALHHNFTLEHTSKPLFEPVEPV